MENLPVYISFVFGFTALLTLALFYLANRNSRNSHIILTVWLILQSIIGISGFYTETDLFPPRLFAIVLPPMLLILVLFNNYKGKQFLDKFDVKVLTILHVVRIPVEIVLYWLFVQQTVPELMTFEGRNFDIISGLTAPIIYYFGYIKKQIPNKLILVWNFICLGLLLNIVINAALSAPFQFQQFAFEQPNIAVLHFPFNLLPGFIVPIVLFSHLVCIRQLLKEDKNQIK
ncbi:MAG: hypothetical protein IPO62_01115 [Saprospiraceae bacterium]|nr:hypothetical protein [Saprospiraceae bacterium]